MKQRRDTPLDQSIAALREKQSSTVFPDTMRNGKSVDAFLWHGSSDATTVQRVGACLFGIALSLVVLIS
jgi:hypothetical protein